MVGLEPPAAGVTAASGGNHGIAVARAAATLGVKARIFVPEISSAAKVARIRQEGAEVTVKGARHADALAACGLCGESGALAIHAYNAEATLLGQGTPGRAEAQANDLDTVMVAVGGGGLIGGIAAWYSGAHQILGIEPSGCNALAAALAAGGPVVVETEGIAADSLGASRLGELSYGILAQTGARSVLVEDRDIVAARPGCGTISGSSPSPVGRRRSRRCCRAATSPTPKSGLCGDLRGECGSGKLRANSE